MNTLFDINFSAKNNPQKLVADAEEKYAYDIKNLAAEIVTRSDRKIILIAGPSGSGKTTTAHILKDNITALGKTARVVSLDHFYLPLGKMPLLKNGDPDFESVYSLNISEIQHCIKELSECGKTEIPIFDFNRAEREEKKLLIDVGKEGYLIVEGIHALNPIITERISQKLFYRVYVNVNSEIYDNSGKLLLTSRKMRLIRRISRDFLYRNTSVEETLKLWTSVTEGEEKYLYKFKSTADIQISTFHSFEPCIFKEIIIPLLKNLPKETENYDYVMLIKKALEQFVAIDCNSVPETSLIKEFIKGGIYEQSK